MIEFGKFWIGDRNSGLDTNNFGIRMGSGSRMPTSTDQGPKGLRYTRFPRSLLSQSKLLTFIQRLISYEVDPPLTFKCPVFAIRLCRTYHEFDVIPSSMFKMGLEGFRWF